MASPFRVSALRAYLAVLLVSAASAQAQTPKLTSYTPATISASTLPQLITVKGQNFRTGMVVYVDGSTALPGSVVLLNGSAFRWTVILGKSVVLTARNNNGGLSVPLTVTVMGQPPPPALAVICPANLTGASPDGNPLVVNYPSAAASGGTPPYTYAYNPASHSFPVGTTTVATTATDAVSAQAVCSFTVTVTYVAPPPPPPPNGQLPANGPDPPETSTAPNGYAARIKAPINQMHFTEGLLLRFFADVQDPNAWTCPPGHPPYVCPGSSVSFFVDDALVGTIPPSATDFDLWELALPAGLPRGDHRITCSFTGNGGVVVPCNAPGVLIHIDPPPAHANTVTLAADLVLSGSMPLNWFDVTANGNGFKLTAAAGYSGSLSISNSALKNLGVIDVTTTGAVTIDHAIHEASDPIHIVAGAVSVTSSEFRQNDRQVYVSSNPDAGTLIDLTATTAPIFRGNNVGSGIVRLAGPVAWDVSDNIVIGIRGVLSPSSASTTIVGNYLHHDYPIGFSQGFNLYPPVGVSMSATENVIREASWTVQNFCGTFSRNLIVDQAQHNSWRTTCSNTTIDHNLFTHYGGHGSGDSGIALFYSGEQNVRIDGNTFHGGGDYFSPIVQLLGGSSLTSFSHNLAAGFTGSGPLIASDTPGKVGTADWNAWGLGGAMPYGGAVVSMAPGANDVTGDPMFAQPIDMQYRWDEGCVWLRSPGCAVADVLTYYRTMLTPGNPAMANRGATYDGSTSGPVATPGVLVWINQVALRKATLPTSPQYPTWLEAKAQADRYLTLAPNYGYAGDEMATAIQALGLAYQATGNTAYADKARENVRAIIALPDSALTGDSGYPSRNLLLGLGLGYNWCHDRFTAADTTATFATINRWFDLYKDGGFLDANGPAYSNYFGGHLLGFGIAGLGTVGVNPRGQEIADYMRAKWGIVQAEFTSGIFQGGFPAEGYTYGANHFTRLLQYLAAVKSVTGEDLVGSIADKILISFIHNRKPNRWQFPDEADYAGDWTGIPDRSLLVMLTGLATSAGYATAFYQQMTDGPKVFPASPMSILLWSGTAAPIDFRLTFPHTSRSPGDGRVVTRSDWTDTAVWTSFNASALFLGYEPNYSHSMRAAGHLAIQRGTDYLLVNSGQWKGPDGWGGNPQAFDGRNWRGNTLGYPVTWGANYRGGQGYWGAAHILAKSETPTYTYTVADETSAYGRVTDVQQWTRTLVTLANGTSVLCDHAVGPQAKTLYFHGNQHGRWTVTGNAARTVVGTSALVLTSDHALGMALPDPVSDSDMTTVTWRLEVVDAAPDARYVTVLQPIASSATPDPVTIMNGVAQIGTVHVACDAAGLPMVQ